MAAPTRQEFRFEKTITADDLADAVRLALRGSRAFEVAATVTILAGAFLVVTSGDPLGFMFILAGLAGFFAQRQPYVYRALARVRDRRLIGGRSVHVIDDEGIHTENPLGTWTTAWKEVTRVRSDERLVVFESGRDLAGYIPTSAFRSPAERDSLITFARERCCISGASNRG